jgi:hypothetical protein
MDALDSKVIELTTALSVTMLILIDELERRHPGLKASYTATLARVVVNEETRPRHREQAIKLLRAMLKGLERKGTGPRTLH